MSSPPGSTGLPVIGETMHFLSDIRHFLDSRIARYGPVFRSNILAAPTVFSCTYSTTLQLLQQKQPGSFDAATAYAEFMGPLYAPDNVLLSPDHSQNRARAAVLLEKLLISSLPNYQNRLLETVRAHFTSVSNHPQNSATSLKPYAMFKKLTERIITTTVLGPLPEKEYKRIRQLCSLHFNGIVAAPINVQFLGLRSARAAATTAYGSLCRIIEQRLAAEIRRKDGPQKDCVVGVLAADSKEHSIREHVEIILLLLSTVIPKALASALTSAVLLFTDAKHADMQNTIRNETRKHNYESLDMFLLETLRLFPPITGGLRLSQGAKLEKFQIDAGTRVWYSCVHSNRDAAVYKHADKFDAHRWKGQAISGKSTGCPFGRAGKEGGNGNGNDNGNGIKMGLSFGAGQRHCPGRDVAWMVMRHCMSGLLDTMEICDTAHSANWMHTLRYVPVLRTVDDVLVEIRRV